ncbi:hypothetical protein OV079_02560 [Nannocystis pusilla]|uniref:Uncharacterized protein n=1 Tax=Nannocystis pusilla TaxID=889268 RepID=A0A9X3IW64_9BACT|nr:hypothetical protein [Nannocystis pusilla]MCY1004468.1 hypothetical protein [Nannocystis pusilla]
MTHSSNYPSMSFDQITSRVSASMRAEAQTALARRVERAVLDRRSAQDRVIRAIHLTHAAVRGVLEADNGYRHGMAQLWQETTEDLRRLRLDPLEATPPSRAAELTDRAALNLLGVPELLAAAATRNHLDILVPPYADSWNYSEGSGTPHARQQTWANAATGELGFDYLIFPESGNIYCGAAVWVDFMRQSPGSPPGQGAPGTAQLRVYAPYNYMWHNMCSLQAAHSEAGLGFTCSAGTSTAETMSSNRIIDIRPGMIRPIGTGTTPTKAFRAWIPTLRSE